MGNTNVSKTKWKYGLRLIACRCNLNPIHVWDGCQDCADFGEYWRAPDGGVIRMGELEKWLKARAINHLQRPLTPA